MKNLFAKLSRAEAGNRCLEMLLDSVNVPVKDSGSVGGTEGDNAKYGGVTAYRKEYNWAYPCHAYVKSMPDTIAFWSRFVKRSSLPKKVNRAYFDWITSDSSPWKTFKARKTSVVPKDFDGDVMDFIYTNGWVWDDLDHPVNLQHNFLVASRMAAEWPTYIRQWYDWQSHGLNPALVFAFVRLVNKSGSLYYINRSNQYDWPLDVNTAGEEYIKNFCHGKVVGKLLENFSKTCHYKPVNTIWGDANVSSEKRYPNILVGLYSKKYGSQKNISGLVSSNNNWSFTEKELFEIIKSEQERLKIV